jgi:hypothetical protein
LMLDLEAKQPEFISTLDTFFNTQLIFQNKFLTIS